MIFFLNSILFLTVFIYLYWQIKSTASGPLGCLVLSPLFFNFVSLALGLKKGLGGGKELVGLVYSGTCREMPTAPATWSMLGAQELFCEVASLSLISSRMVAWRLGFTHRLCNGLNVCTTCPSSYVEIHIPKVIWRWGLRKVLG